MEPAGISKPRVKTSMAFMLFGLTYERANALRILNDLTPAESKQNATNAAHHWLPGLLFAVNKKRLTQ
jgi:hypothetical protein